MYLGGQNLSKSNKKTCLPYSATWNVSTIIYLFMNKILQLRLLNSIRNFISTYYLLFVLFISFGESLSVCSVTDSQNELRTILSYIYLFTQKHLTNRLN